MEPLWGCLAVLLVLIAFVAPVVALVLAIRLRSQLAGLRSELAGLRGLVEVLRRQSAGDRPEAASEQKLPGKEEDAASVEEPRFADAGVAARAGVPPADGVPAPVGVESAASVGDPGAPAPATPGAVPTGPLSLEASAESRVGAGSTPPPAAESARLEAGPGLEERLGARLPIWLGGIALALAGAFLVKYSVDQGWLSPTVRVALGLVFGVVLLGAGEWLRGRSFRVSQALSAAGVAVLYAVLLAGIRLYELIPPLVGFALMAANTAVAVLLSLRQGAIVALLGLVGGFATPALVELGPRQSSGLFLYLLLLDLGLLVVTRRRRWPALAAAALVASMGWAGVWTWNVARGAESLPVGLFLIASAAVFVGAGIGARAGDERAGRALSMVGRWIAVAALGGGLVLLARLVDASGYGSLEWGLFGLLAAGALALARLREEELFGLAPFATAVTLALFAVRGWDLHGEAASRAFLLPLVALGALHALGAWGLSLRSLRPERWSVLSASALLAFPLLGYFTTRDETELPWAWLALALSALSIGLLAPFARGRGAREGGEAALAAFAVAATLFASLALPLALERSWLSVAFALEVPLLLALRDRLEIPALGRLAEAAAGIAAVRLLANPAVLSYPVSSRPIWNGYLFAYGAAAAAFLAAAALARRRARPSATLWDAGAAAFVFALVTVELWHFFDGAGPIEPLRGWGLLEWGSQAVAWGLLGIAGVELGRRLGRRAWAIGGRLALALCGAQSLVVHGLAENPAWTRNLVGETPVFNLLLLAYGAPAALLGWGARAVARDGGRRLPPAARAAALVLLFGLGALEVRQLFRGGDLSVGAVSGAEQFSYSAFGALFGMALLVFGIRRRSKPLRFAALAVMLLAVLKVFLFDTSELEGLYRVFSFLGLGASLLVLAHLYQRFLGRKESVE